MFVLLITASSMILVKDDNQCGGWGSMCNSGSYGPCMDGKWPHFSCLPGAECTKDAVSGGQVTL